MKNIISSSLLLTIFAISCSVNQSNEDPISLLKKDVEFLASDSLKGREFGTSGEKMAAEYIKKEFETLGLQPAGEEGFFQLFTVKKSDNPHETELFSDSENGVTGLNVLALIDNPGDEIIVIGAHFDHLGMGGQSSLDRSGPAVHNGADDNASGTAALIQLARELKSEKLNRDILFFAISGEEKGLWGSNYYVKNPTVDLEKINFMVNMDMVGRLDTARGLAIHGTGTSPVWQDAIDNANTVQLKVIKHESGVGPSDHTSFYLQDMPVLHFFTGQHPDYHKPTDDFDKINYEGILKVTTMIKNLVVNLDKEEKLAFTKTKDESSDSPRFTVTLGVVPDYLFDGKGMRIDGISPDKPAEKAGLQKGDIVIQLGDSSVYDMMSYMRALSSFEKGDKTIVRINRESDEIEYEIEF